MFPQQQRRRSAPAFSAPAFSATSVIVAVPVSNEAERIADCLHALAGQRDAPDFGVLLLLNNCTDDTEAIVRGMAGLLPARLRVLSRELPPRRAHAGAARRIAMNAACRALPADGVLLTTDADGRADQNWLAANLHALRHGADAVAGRAVIDPVEALAIPAALHEADARECAYAALLDEIASLLDPDPADPWPRHDEASGASLAVTATAYRRAGGMPAWPLGEDREFVARLRRCGARLRHAPEVRVTVSGRLHGRASGGMADTMRRRMSAMDVELDERLEPATDAARRARLRAMAREAHRSGAAGLLAAALGLPAARLDRWLARNFAVAWQRLELASPRLRRRRVPVSELPREMARATAIRDALRRE